MIIKRILQFIENEGLSKSEFYRKVGLSNGFLSRDRDVGLRKLTKILEAYPQINPLWFLLGEGTMYKNSAPYTKQTIKGNNNVANLSSHNQIAPNSELDQLRMKMDFLERENTNLKDIIATKDELIALLRNK